MGLEGYNDKEKADDNGQQSNSNDKRLDIVPMEIPQILDPKCVLDLIMPK